MTEQDYIHVATLEKVRNLSAQLSALNLGMLLSGLIDSVKLNKINEAESILKDIEAKLGQEIANSIEEKS